MPRRATRGGSSAHRGLISTSIGQLTEVPLLAWPAIQSGDDALIAAPIGSRKTLTAFLSSIDQLFILALACERNDLTHGLHIFSHAGLRRPVKFGIVREDSI